MSAPGWVLVIPPGTDPAVWSNIAHRHVGAVTADPLAAMVLVGTGQADGVLFVSPSQLVGMVEIVGESLSAPDIGARPRRLYPELHRHNERR